jgi:uncharacterized protein (TIGR02996 family)
MSPLSDAGRTDIMADRDAFLAAIRADPDDDTNRLVYADWLDDHGQPQRAEFIRLQCELARLPPADPRRPALQGRERELLRAHRRAWAAELPPLAGVRWVPFERGFAARAVFNTLKAFTDRFEEAVTYAPLTQVVLRNLSARSIVRLASVAHLRQVRELVLLDCLPDDDSAGALASSPHVAGLRALYLTHGSVTDVGAFALAASPHLGQLGVLSLASTRVGAAGVLAVLDSPQLGGLRQLYCWGNSIGDGGADALLRAERLDRLEEIILGGCGIGRERADALRKRLGTRVKV